MRALAYGGAGRVGRALWQPGNVVKVRLTQRGEGAPVQVSGELLYGCAARILSMPLALAMMQSACVLADATLPRVNLARHFLGRPSNFFPLSLQPRCCGADRPAQLH